MSNWKPDDVRTLVIHYLKPLHAEYSSIMFVGVILLILIFWGSGSPSLPSGLFAPPYRSNFFSFFGARKNEENPGEVDEYGISVVRTHFEKTVITGSTSSFSAEPGIMEVFAVGFSDSLEPEWLTVIQSNDITKNEFSTSVIEHSDGNMVILADMELFGMEMIKMDYQGEIVWVKRIHRSPFGWNFGNAAAIEDNNIVLFDHYNLGITVICVDMEGEKIWIKSFGGPSSDVPVSFSVSSDGADIYVTGTTKSFGPGGKSVLVFRTDIMGNVGWANVYGSDEDQTPTSSVVTPEDDVMYVVSKTEDDEGRTNLLLLRLQTSDGRILSSCAWSDDSGMDLTPSSVKYSSYDDTVVVSGYALGNSSTHARGFVAKVDATLENFIWGKMTDYISNTSVEIYDMEVISDRYLVTGRVTHPTSNEDVLFSVFDSEELLGNCMSEAWNVQFDFNVSWVTEDSNFTLSENDLFDIYEVEEMERTYLYEHDQFDSLLLNVSCIGCGDGYFDHDCSLTTCLGVFSNETGTPDLCSGHGSCWPSETCNCYDNYDHPVLNSTYTEFFSCDNYSCFHVHHEDDLVCSGHGNCTSHDACECELPNYDSASDCGEWDCFEYTNKNDLVCGGHGDCLEFDHCDCDEGYVDESCVWSCFNISFRSPAVCGGYGSCTALDFCDCLPGYSDSEDHQCDTWECFGFSSHEVDLVCSTHGVCESPNICSCTDDYEGYTCEDWLCGTSFKLGTTCSGNGVCIAPSTCHCDQGFSGDMCEVNTLYYTVMTPILSVAGTVFIIFLLCLFSAIVCLGVMCCCVICISLGVIFGLTSRNRIQKLRMLRFKKLKNFDLLLKEQEMDEDSNTAHLRINRSLFEIEFDSIKLIRILGKGGSNSVVYEAEWNKQVVGFKCFRTSDMCQSQQSFDEFEKEVSILGSVSHPHILQFYGCTLQPPRVGIVMEFCEKGDLVVFCRRFKLENNGKRVPFSLKTTFLEQIIQGMNYLTKRNIIHRDLKLENVLVDKNNDVKIMDFGLSRLAASVSKGAMTTRVGTSYYMAPELITSSGNYGSEVDVFSFGVCIYVLYSENMHPYGPQAMSGVELKVANDPLFRPDIHGLDDCGIPEQVLESLKDLVRACWSHEASKRPSFGELSTQFSDMLMGFEGEDVFDDPNSMSASELESSKKSEVEAENEEADSKVDLSGVGLLKFDKEGEVSKKVFLELMERVKNLEDKLLEIQRN